MSTSTDKKLVIAVASRAIFDLEHENRIFKKSGLEVYRKYQRQHESILLRPGPAFCLVKKLLGLNSVLKDRPVEVVIVSRNDADTSVRIFKSIRHYNLTITRGAFTNGAPNHAYLQAFDSSLYLSAHLPDVRNMIQAGFAAAHVIGAHHSTNINAEGPLRVAFDFDGVLASDQAEEVYKSGGLEAFFQHEVKRRRTQLAPGPIFKFAKAIVGMRKRANGGAAEVVRTAIVTARNSPAHERLVITLRELGLIIDETIFLGGMKKAAFVEAFRPDIFFDDQLRHLEGIANVVTAFVPYGIANATASTQIKPKRSLLSGPK